MVDFENDLWWERARQEFGGHVVEPRGVTLSYSKERLRR